MANEQERRPFWILLEGVDGVGKSTVARELAKLPQIVGENPLVLHCPCPNDDTVGDRIFECPEASLWYRAAEEIEAYHRQILPALLEDRTVICDRW